ncbi:uncharacterized protein LOC108116081 [Drosophila eugracilis]|uniref:uncharacterized protein LOC108116081 n=1 Tax=Drosophila eugracilis TaxID=29029 RepID=UPI001BDAFF7C|nr:uncharacterized protein LOC108116081 [Drosophila eugracilis]
MSLASIKQKESKGKKKCLPKLRTVLANPYKQHSPVLSTNDVIELREIFKKAIEKSGEERKSFATRFGIHLGLESSVRATNSRRFSCLLVSLSLRPAHLIRLITTSASVKVPTAPIYAQPKLEELTEEIFGVRALSLTLPLELKVISEELEQWVAARKRTAPTAIRIAPKTYKRAVKKPSIIRVTENEKNAVRPVTEKKDWGDDFISCSSDKPSIKLDRADVQVETQKLGNALTNLAMKGKSKRLEVEEIKQKPAEKQKSPSLEPMDSSPDEDDFLPRNLQTYRPLTLQIIRPNPDKRPKKKRNKKSKQT